MPPSTDPLPLTRALIACQSVTPADAGALDLVQNAAEALGFTCQRMPFGQGDARIDNLFAKRDTGVPGPHLAFAGHTDVVPAGDIAAWTSPPFVPTERDGKLYGRGAADMKSAIACFLSAVATATPQAGTVSLLITGDEEGPALHGTKPLMAKLHALGERFDHVIVGEPTSIDVLGDTLKIGRRGSCNVVLTVTGTQGHVAYPHRAENPLPVLLDILNRWRARDLDDGKPVDHFQPSNLEITTIDVANPPHNVIPATATAKANIRFNIAHQGEHLVAWLQDEARQATIAAGFSGRVEVDARISGEAFLTQESPTTHLIQTCVETITGRHPTPSTGGGTSDARFIKDYAPVVELGLVGASIHQVDEHANLADIQALSDIYAEIITRYCVPQPAK